MLDETDSSVLRKLHGLLSHQPISSPEQFGDLIKALLKEAHLPMEVVANSLGHSQLMIECWATYKRLPAEECWPILTEKIIDLIDKELRARKNNDDR